MTPLPSSQPAGKRLGKQIRGYFGPWGSKLARTAETICSEFRRSLETVDYDGFWAIPMPEASAGPLQHASCCFPHASPVSASRAGKQKTAPQDRKRGITPGE
jgi:hypothetical protein